MEEAGEDGMNVVAAAVRVEHRHDRMAEDERWKFSSVKPLRECGREGASEPKERLRRNFQSSALKYKFVCLA